MDTPFIHLHCHSHYSLLDGAGKIEDLVKRAKDLGMPALALTDHGNLFGALEFYQTAKEAGIKPIIGYEAYVATGSRTERGGTQKDVDEDDQVSATVDPDAGFFGASATPESALNTSDAAPVKQVSSRKNTSNHLTLLALNHAGYKNLLKLSSIANLEGFYFKPRIDKEVLEKHNEGLICLSGCALSEVSKLIAEGTAESYAQAKEVASWYRQVFGDRYYIEIQNNNLTIQKMILGGLVKLAGELNIPTVATNDVHYIHQKDYDAQDVLLCVNTGKLRDDPKRMRMYTDPLKPGQLIDQYFFRSGSDMKRALPGHEDAIARTMEIADRVNIELKLGEKFFPVFTPPGGLSPDDYLRQLCLEGLKKRYANNPKRCKDGQLASEVLTRLDRELSVISELGFQTYFLIVGDIVRVAEERGIYRSARGSGVGALVCYALYMTPVCPLEWDLLFERFLDLSRRESPDIDIDFDQDRREEMLNYVTEKYGKDNVAQLGTFGTMGVKSSINDVGRALGMSIPEVSAITKQITDEVENLDEALQKIEELGKRYEHEEQVKALFDYAKQIEGLVRHTGVHPCGVVIADKPLIEYVPLRLGKDGGVVSQWEGGSVEAAGLLKMDLLGLRNLTVLVHAIDLIRETTGKTVDPYQLPLDAKETYELLSRGETKGVFQFEQPHVREILPKMRPDCFQDIIALNAMNRPGPSKNIPLYIDIKHGKSKATYAHPVLKEILTETNGIMIYQEQIMQVINRLGNIPLGDAYSCIKAISKKKEKEISKYRDNFIAGAQANGLAVDKANEVFELILKFAGYGFNKSHSTAYAWLIYMTAYFKAHYPVEYMAALLCGDISKRNFSSKDPTVEHIEDCRRMGIEIIPPDVNTSKRLYSVADGKIVYALSAIKSCGDWAADQIVAAREKGGKFRDLFDFCERVDNRACNRAAIESLIKAGAFDSMGYKRSQLLQCVETALKAGQGAAEEAARGQGSLFGNDDEPEMAVPRGLPTIPEWTDKEKSLYEKEVLGFYLTSHPLQEFDGLFAMLRTHECSESTVLPDRTQVVLAGTVTDIKIATTKNSKPGKPNRFAMFTLEDTAGSVRSIMWADAYEEYMEFIRNDSIVFMRGRMDRNRSAYTNSPDKGNSPDANFIVDEVFSVDEAPQKLCRGLTIAFDEQQHSSDLVETVQKMLRETPGGGAVELSLRLKEGATAVFNGGKVTVGVTPVLYRRLTECLGADAATILRTAPPQRQQKSGYREKR